jgi:hypothetical protein
MMFEWGSHIPFISVPESYGSPLYLGPFFNLLPIIAVTLMIIQQKYTMPPPTDEQQEMQQKMMKFMMIFFGLMFYKVAAGLCVYFISSSVWGFCERKLLPKKKQSTDEPTSESLLQRVLKRGENGTEAPPTSTAVTAAPRSGTVPTPVQEARGGGKRKKGRRRPDGNRGPAGELDRMGQDGVRGWWQVRKEKLSAWWQELLRQAEKKR